MRLLKLGLPIAMKYFSYYEQKSRTLFGREPAQVILLHDNWMEADHISELLALLRKRNYQFVSLGEALNDQAYSSPDTFISMRRRLLHRSLGSNTGEARTSGSRTCRS